MKKFTICTLLAAVSIAALLNINDNITTDDEYFNFKNSYAIVLGYDKSMGE